MMKPDRKSNAFNAPRGAVVSACGNSGQWQHALALLSEMQRNGIQGKKSARSLIFCRMKPKKYWLVVWNISYFPNGSLNYFK